LLMSRFKIELSITVVAPFRLGNAQKNEEAGLY